MLSCTQIPKVFRDIINEEIEFFKITPSITEVNTIPKTNEIPLDNKTHWLKIKDVICVFVDMRNSTKISVENGDSVSARSMKLFTETATKIFHEADSPYIDIKGDGVFALFNKNEPHKALATAVAIKTFCVEEFIPRVSKITNADIGVHIGIDQHSLLVKKIGLRFREGRTDRQNEVWAGKTVNMAAKLASLTKRNELLVSDRFYAHLSDNKALLSCGCRGDEKVQPQSLWKVINLENDKFDFTKAHMLESNWCTTHGEEFCNYLLTVDTQK